MDNPITKILTKFYSQTWKLVTRNGLSVDLYRPFLLNEGIPNICKCYFYIFQSLSYVLTLLETEAALHFTSAALLLRILIQIEHMIHHLPRTFSGLMYPESIKKKTPPPSL